MIKVITYGINTDRIYHLAVALNSREYHIGTTCI